MCETYYCQECGCEIRNSIAGCEQKEYWTETVIICASCMEAADRMMEKIADAPEFEIDAAFEKFCREYRTDENLREVFA